MMTWRERNGIVSPGIEKYGNRVYFVGLSLSKPDTEICICLWSYSFLKNLNTEII
jgi:hypothetical protein